ISESMLERFVNVDYADRLALVGVLGSTIVAVGRYERLPSGLVPCDEAEVAFLVDDAEQGRGIGTVLLEQLAAYAAATGITRFVADTLPENSRMLRVFHEAGFGEQRSFSDGVIRVAFPITATETSRALAHERERQATARSVRRLLAPRSVAVVGASRQEDTVGHRLLRAILDGGFNGPVFPVNRAASHVCSIRAYPSVLDIPEPVDLAIVAVRAAEVTEVLDHCARRRVGGLVVVSSGFAETGEAGRRAERLLVSEARRNGMRIVGPNSMGLVNTDPGVSLAAAFGPLPLAGQVGFVAQSGALAAVVIDELGRRSIGISSFVSTGNKADISGNDLLQYWEDDPSTSVVCMYTETFGNPRTFARVARRVARTKPIVMVKSAGSTAPASSTEGPARSDPAVGALLRQTGVLRTETLEELLDVAQVLVSQPLPAGRRVATIGSDGGPAALAAEACLAAHLEPATLSALTVARIGAELPAARIGTGIVGLPPDATPEMLGSALRMALDDAGVDSAIALFTSLLDWPVERVAAAVDAAALGRPGKPVVTSILGRRGLLAVGSRSVPSFAFPEPAARALGRMTDYSQWRRRPEGRSPELDVEPSVAREVIAGELATAGPTGCWLSRSAATAVASAYGIDLLASISLPQALADPAELAREAIEAAHALGYPVVVGADPGAERAHPERRNLRLWLTNDAAVSSAVRELIGCGPLFVQASATAGHDLAVGVSQDPDFGPLIELGTTARLGGPLLVSRSRILPLTDLDAAGLRQEVLGSGGLAGGPPGAGSDAALDNLLLRASQLIEDLPEVTELDLVPVVVSAERAAVAGIRLHVQAPQPHPERALRRLH
ncbi:MAG: GNAT family N-acetyltransferase, partial [Actinomycetota bacterium]|nr:GNAT family N-acetyltransferase [Actinomycetota bacterium]